MARSVYKICSCRDQVKCRHPWWFSVKHRGASQMRKSLDVVLERHIDSKTIAEREAERLRIGMTDDTLSARTRELLGLPVSTKPALPTLTIGQLLKTYAERHVSRSATVDRQGYQIGIVVRTVLPRPTGGTAALGEWPVADVTADTLERLREARVVRDVHARTKGSNLVGGPTAANRDLRLLRAAFNWALRTGYVDRTPFKRGTVSAVTLTKERARSRRLQAGEEVRLLAACHPHLRPIVEAALETGCRKGELLGLQWSQVQFAPRPELWLPADKTKTGKARRVPISTRLKPVLEMRRDALRAALELKDDETLPSTLFVFGNEIGERVGAIKTSWLGACARANIHGLHFHDLRREAGSRWMEAGVPLATIQKWLGHTNIAQTSTYLSTTTAGEHEAMQRFEERIGRLIPLDTGGATPLHIKAQSTTTANRNAQQTSTKH
jgi:integrase